MSDEQATHEVSDLGEIPSTVIAPETSGVTVIPASELKPEDVGTLSLRYVDGTPVLVVNGGTVFPDALAVVDASGSPVATYTAGPKPLTPQARVRVGASTNEALAVNVYAANVQHLFTGEV